MEDSLDERDSTQETKSKRKNKSRPCHAKKPKISGSSNKNEGNDYPVLVVHKIKNDESAFKNVDNIIYIAVRAENFEKLKEAERAGDVPLLVKGVGDRADVIILDPFFTTVHYAVELNEASLVKTLINIGRSVNVKNEKGDTPLHLAVGVSYEISKMLLNAGALPNELNLAGESPLHIAVSKNRCITVELLLENGAMTNSQNCRGETPLHVAIQSNADIYVVNMLLEHGASSDIQNRESLTPVHLIIDKHNRLPSGIELVIDKLLQEKGSKYVQFKSDVSGNTLLHAAAKHGLLKTLKNLLKQGADVDLQNHAGSTPLLLALYNKHEEIAETLIQVGADVNIRNHDKKDTPLHVSITKSIGTEQKISHILLSKGAYVNILDREGNTPLHCAVISNAKTVVEAILKRKPKLDAQNKYGDTPLHLCIKEGHSLIAELLLKKKPLINVKNKAGETPLHIIAQKHDLRIAEMLLQSGADKTEKNKDGDTALHIAIRRDIGSIAKLLVDKGASGNVKNNKSVTPVNLIIDKEYLYPTYETILKKLLQDKKSKFIKVQNPNKNTLLHKAAQNGFLEVVNILLDGGALINSRNCDGDTPLSLALHRGHKEVVKTLIERGANINNINGKNQTPLLISISRDVDANIICLLLSKGAYLNIADNDGNTPLHYCVKHEAKGVLESILNKGASPDMQNSKGDTPLHLCAKGKHRLFQLAELLIDKKANVNVKNKDGATPLHYVANHLEFAKRLLKAGANVDAKNNHGDTVLLKAASLRTLSQKRYELVQKLIESGATVDIRSKHNKTAYQLSHLCHIKSILVRHIMKLKAANLRINETVDCVDLLNLGSDFELKILQELERIKNTKISENLNLGIVFSHFEKPHYLKSEDRCRSLEEFLKSPILRGEFPEFWYILRNTFENTKCRFLLVTQAEHCFDIIFFQSKKKDFDIWRGNLPDLVKQRIMDYLNNKDLKTLIDAIENNNKFYSGSNVTDFYK